MGKLIKKHRGGLKNKTHPSELQKLQKKIFESLTQEAQSLMGRTPKEILRYETTYRTELRRSFQDFKVSTRKKLIQSALAADVVLIGDYHTYQQAQRTALRVLRELVSKRSGEPYVLGLEFVSAQHQKVLDDFMRNRVSEKEFLKTIDYENVWGFPWEHYSPLLEFAKKSKIKAIALNRPKGPLPPLAALKNAKKSGDLGARDEWAAGLILDQVHAGKKVIAVYGELHLSPSHIPDNILLLSKINAWKTPRTLVLHQNQDELFWILAEKKIEHTAGIIELSNGDFCIFSGTPWTRIQSLINWLQGDLASFMDEEEDPNEEFLSWMKRAGTSLSEFFGVPAPAFDVLTVYGPGETRYRWLKPLIQSQERVYWKDSINDADVYVPAYTENSAAELAGIHLLHGENKKLKHFSADPVSSLALILDHAFGLLCSLILNPRRKSDTLLEHKKRLKNLKTDKPLFAHEREARTIYIKLEQVWKKSPEQLEQFLKLKSHDPSARYTACRYFGHALGRELYDRLLKLELNSEMIREALIEPGKRPGNHRWWIFLELMKSLRKKKKRLPGESL